jgi:hypothetical protein
LEVALHHLLQHGSCLWILKERCHLRIAHQRLQRLRILEDLLQMLHRLRRPKHLLQSRWHPGWHAAGAT